MLIQLQLTDSPFVLPLSIFQIAVVIQFQLQPPSFSFACIQLIRELANLLK